MICIKDMENKDVSIVFLFSLVLLGFLLYMIGVQPHINFSFILIFAIALKRIAKLKICLKGVKNEAVNNS